MNSVGFDNQTSFLLVCKKMLVSSKSFRDNLFFADMHEASVPCKPNLSSTNQQCYVHFEYFCWI